MIVDCFGLLGFGLLRIGCRGSGMGEDKMPIPVRSKRWLHFILRRYVAVVDVVRWLNEKQFSYFYFLHFKRIVGVRRVYLHMKKKMKNRKKIWWKMWGIAFRCCFVFFLNISFILFNFLSNLKWMFFLLSCSPLTYV